MSISDHPKKTPPALAGGAGRDYIGGMWLMIFKIAAVLLVVEVSVRLLSRVRAGDGSDRANHLRGWLLVAILTVTVVFLAWFRV